MKVETKLEISRTYMGCGSREVPIDIRIEPKKVMRISDQGMVAIAKDVYERKRWNSFHCFENLVF